jgi:hypothetical protein
MSRIAYLTGESGAGKGHLKKELDKVVSIDKLVGDLVLSDTAPLLPPDLDGRHPMDTELWLKRARHPELRATFRAMIVKRYPDFSRSTRPVLAEATLFCIKDLFDAFHGAVQDLRPDLVESKMFWIDASAEKLVKQIADRPREERKIGVEEAKQRLAFFNGQMVGHVSVRRAEYEQIREAIQGFLST